MKRKKYLKKLSKKLDETDHYFTNELSEIIKIADKCLVDDSILTINKVKIFFLNLISKVKLFKRGKYEESINER